MDNDVAIIRKGLLSLQKEKLEQLKTAVKNVRVDKMVALIQDINTKLINSIDNEEEGQYKLKLIECLRKNYEFLVKVADIPFNLPITQDTSVGVAPVDTISFEDLPQSKVIDLN